MNKGIKIAIFSIICFITVLAATVAKEMGAAVFSVGAIFILILYRTMFKKSPKEE